MGGEGFLDAEEFALAVEDLGFPNDFGHTVFTDLDKDGSGTISYPELVEALHNRTGEAFKMVSQNRRSL